MQIILPIIMALFVIVGWGGAQDINPKLLHALQIRNLERNSNPTAKDLYTLAYNHKNMGDFYAIISQCMAYVMLDASQCLIDDVSKIHWGAEYFKASAFAELGKYDSAIVYAGRIANANSAPAMLKGLAKVIKIAAQQKKGNSTLSWASFNPLSYYDSLEIFFNIMRNDRESKESFPLRETKEIDKIALNPLIARCKVLNYLNDDAKEPQLRQLLREYDSTGMPMWRLNLMPLSPVFLGDPGLAFLLSQVHYKLAQIDYKRGIALSGNQENIPPRDLINGLKVAVKLKDCSWATDLISGMQESDSLLPFRGWIAWCSNDKDKALQYWNKCNTLSNYSIIYDMILVIAPIPELSELSKSIRTKLRDYLGDSKNQAVLFSRPDEREKMNIVNRTLGFWYLQNGIIDSASIYYGNLRDKQEISLKNANIAICSEYFTSKTISERTDFRQEGFEGWNNIDDYFPSVVSIIKSLNFAILCKAGIDIIKGN
jgi:hypothetical protein